MKNRTSRDDATQAKSWQRNLRMALIGAALFPLTAWLILTSIVICLLWHQWHSDPAFPFTYVLSKAAGSSLMIASVIWANIERMGNRVLTFVELLLVAVICLEILLRRLNKPRLTLFLCAFFSGCFFLAAQQNDVKLGLYQPRCIDICDGRFSSAAHAATIL